MDEPIKKGDLVMVVRGMPCCGKIGVMGSVWTATGYRTSSYTCRCCNRENFEDEIEVEGYRYFGISRLKRIPPLGELDEIPTQERIEA